MRHKARTLWRTIHRVVRSWGRVVGPDYATLGLCQFHPTAVQNLHQ